MKTIIINKTTDEKENVFYDVEYYKNVDGSAEKTRYKSTDDLTKLLPILSKSISGLSKDSDRVTAFLNDDGTIDHVEHHVNSPTKDDAPEEKTLVAQEVVDKGADVHIAEFEAQIVSKKDGGGDVPADGAGADALSP